LTQQIPGRVQRCRECLKRTRQFSGSSAITTSAEQSLCVGHSSATSLRWVFAKRFEKGPFVFYLIGVEHKVQYISKDGTESANHAEFRVCLQQAIEDFRPSVVAEEFSNDSLARATWLSNGVPQEFF